MSLYPDEPTMKHVVPTTEEKLAIFQRALVYVQRNRFARCICLGVREAQNDLSFLNEYGYPLWQTTKKHISDDGNNMEANFPELFKRKPKGKSLSEAWWTYREGQPTKRRLDAINGIIAELEAKQKAEATLAEWREEDRLNNL
jgi:hypothetical protein